MILVAACFSQGFFHPDEHYQVLELVNLKMGTYTDKTIFNWDFNDKIRPWFQAFLYYLILKPLSIFDLDPFQSAFVLRLFNGLVGLCAVTKVIGFFSAKKNIKSDVLVVMLCWFVPFFLVRTNSESLSSSLFFLGSFFFLEENSCKKNALFSGVLWGLSFLCRYQMGVVIFSVNMWFLFRHRRILPFIVHSLTLVLVIALGVLIDRWGYGTWEFAPYNYFYQNIVQSRASEFGVDSVWYYFWKPLIKGVPPISIVLLIGVIIYGVKEKINFWSVAFVSFLFVHSMIGHKEVRFLFFNYLLAVLMSIRVFSKLDRKRWPGLLYVPVFVINFGLLAKVLFTSAASEIDLYKEVHHRKIDHILVLEPGPGKFNFTMPFYQRGPVETTKTRENTDRYVLTTKFGHVELFGAELKGCRSVYQTYPFWIKKFDIFDWSKRSSFMVLWDCPLKS